MQREVLHVLPVFAQHGLPLGRQGLVLRHHVLDGETLCVDLLLALVWPPVVGSSFAAIHNPGVRARSVRRPIAMPAV